MSTLCYIGKMSPKTFNSPVVLSAKVRLCNLKFPYKFLESFEFHRVLVCIWFPWTPPVLTLDLVERICAKGERERGDCGCNSAFGAHLSLSWTDGRRTSAPSGMAMLKQEGRVNHTCIFYEGVF